MRRYRRVTTGATPMNRFVALGMAATLVGIGARAVVGDLAPGWSAASALLALPPIALAGARVVSVAVRLGERGDELVVQAGAALST